MHFQACSNRLACHQKLFTVEGLFYSEMIDDQRITVYVAKSNDNVDKKYIMIQLYDNEAYNHLSQDDILLTLEEFMTYFGIIEKDYNNCQNGVYSFIAENDGRLFTLDCGLDKITLKLSKHGEYNYQMEAKPLILHEILNNKSFIWNFIKV